MAVAAKASIFFFFGGQNGDKTFFRGEDPKKVVTFDHFVQENGNFS